MPKIGNIPWNKGKKGLQIAWNRGKPRTWKAGRTFKKGQPAWNKGIKRYWDSPTEFKKGCIPWNKGTSGNNCGYAGMHAWIKQALGKPNYCEHCKRNDRKYYDWANKDHTYKKIKEDYLRLCRSCHMKYDYKFNKRRKLNGN